MYRYYRKIRTQPDLLILLSDSAARFSELTTLTLTNLSMMPPVRVKLTRKRNKICVVSLRQKTVEHSQVILKSSIPKRFAETVTGRCSIACIGTGTLRYLPR